MLSAARSCLRIASRVAAPLRNFPPPQSISAPTRLSTVAWGFLRRKDAFCGRILAAKKVTQETASLTARRVSSRGGAANKSQKIVGSWLLTCGGMVFVAVALGGVTRLTESGLSMVTWKLLGEKMPTDESQWIEEFERYKEFPEYKMLKVGMSLEEFKRIWWMEYLHRTWGRAIGLVFAVPATIFWLRGAFTSGTKKRVVILGSLIGLQGLMGWYMVKSGLENRFEGPSDIPRVSQYRLAAHLSLAVLIYSGFLYTALDHLLPASKVPMDYFGSKSINYAAIRGLAKLKKIVYASKGLIFLTVVSGAFVAGLDAGLIYNTFPKMADKWIPDDILAHTPMLANFTENPTTVQFDHRALGIATLTAVTLTGLLTRGRQLPGRAKKAVLAMVAAGYFQASLGIATLLYHAPVHLAALHQSGSLVLLSCALWLCHEFKHVKKFVRL